MDEKKDTYQEANNTPMSRMEPLPTNNISYPHKKPDVVLPTLPSLNEVMKPIFNENPQANRMIPGSISAPPSTLSPIHTVPSGPGHMLPLPSLLNAPLPQTQMSPASKQSIYILNERNQAEFDGQTPMIPLQYGSSDPRVFQEQVQQAKRIGENLQSNLRNYVDPNSKRPKTETSAAFAAQQFEPASIPPPHMIHQQESLKVTPIGVDSRSAFSPLKRKEMSPQQVAPAMPTPVVVPQPAVPIAASVPRGVSPPPALREELDRTKLSDDQNNFAHLLQSNFSGINLTNDSSAELLEIYRNFHKNENAKLTPTSLEISKRSD